MRTNAAEQREALAARRAENRRIWPLVSFAAAASMLPACAQLVGLQDLPAPDDAASQVADASATTAGDAAKPKTNIDAGANPTNIDAGANQTSIDGSIDARSDTGAVNDGGRDKDSGGDASGPAIDSGRDRDSGGDASGAVDPCAGVTCKDGPAPSCTSTTVRRTATGTCNRGLCNYDPIDEICPSNTLCSGGTCVVCKSDTSCGLSCSACVGATPKCKSLGTSSQCVGCIDSTQCASDSMCSTTTNQCVCSPSAGGQCVGSNVRTCGADGQWKESPCAWPTPACSNGACIAPPSCYGLATTCGPQGNESCCLSPLVTGGTFYRSYDGVSADYLSKANPATVANYRLDKYEITVGRFRKFVASGEGTKSSPPKSGAGARSALADSGWNSDWNSSLVADGGHPAALKCSTLNASTWTDASGANENMPINCLDWFQAFAFCAWDGGFLPTEAEWNYAAAGGSEQRVYAWPNVNGAGVIDCNHDDTFECHASIGVPFVVGSTLPTGAGKWGQAGLNGGVSEWTLDYEGLPYPNPCTNCAALTPTYGRVFRGGAFLVNTSYSPSAIRSGTNFDRHFDYVGARCARIP